MFYSNVNKLFLGTDGAASSRVGQILPLRVEGSIPYSAPLNGRIIYAVGWNVGRINLICIRDRKSQFTFRKFGRIIR